MFNVMFNVVVVVVAAAAVVAGVDIVKYYPKAAAENLMCFKYYDAQKEVMGKRMEEWLRFSVCFWHTFRGTGELIERCGVRELKGTERERERERETPWVSCSTLDKLLNIYNLEFKKKVLEIY